MNYVGFCGPVKVPCIMQYAKKLATMIGDHLQENPSKRLTNYLYYI